MAGNIPHVVVVGGGILGASVAWHLARRGAAVTVLERERGVARGVTGHSYGWVGTGSRLPSADPACFALEQRALAQFPRLTQALGPLPVAAQGGLIWLDSEEQTLAMLAEQQAAGVSMAAVGRERIRELEPGLVQPPAMAIWAPDDFAVEPDVLAQRLLAAAQAEGARVLEAREVLALEVQGARITGVRTGLGIVHADVVVLANAMGAQRLARQLGQELPIHEAPAVLLRFGAAQVPLRHLLYGQGLEVRPGLGGGLLSADDFPGEEGMAELGRESLQAVASLFPPECELSLQSIRAVYRPKTDSGLPLRTFLDGCEGLYVMVAHPGVILAPALGYEACEDILKGQVHGDAYAC
ncbi:FAD-binding oxidoreductase [Pseudomonas sp. B21-047]|uniref:NAD(P)/FAD-dependent oxidoreductase n=1 Tax=Pseudomonas sp. B21-047 TaxID=2895489 RepID=UPI0021600E4B|nr:FAD-binding oxidoreductase [Pseudomonas sp. B21-047]UVL04935.1 FAD-binding oxidoreductase [Pseudomonas sp. B21-047]